MTEYSLQKEKFKMVLRKTLPYSFMSLLLLLIFYLIVRSLANDNMISGGFKLVCGLMLLFVLTKEGLRIYKLRRDWLSFKICITEDVIQKKQYKTPEIIIPINQIAKIVQIADGLSIQSEEANKLIFIPQNIENYEELIGKLNALKPIEVTPLMSARIPSDYMLRQPIRQGSALKHLALGLVLGVGVGFGILISLFLVVIAVLSR